MLCCIILFLASVLSRRETPPTAPETELVSCAVTMVTTSPVTWGRSRVGMFSIFLFLLLSGVFLFFCFYQLQLYSRLQSLRSMSSTISKMFLMKPLKHELNLQLTAQVSFKAVVYFLCYFVSDLVLLCIFFYCLPYFYYVLEGNVCSVHIRETRWTCTWMCFKSPDWIKLF